MQENNYIFFCESIIQMDKKKKMIFLPLIYPLEGRIRMQITYLRLDFYKKIKCFFRSFLKSELKKVFFYLILHSQNDLFLGRNMQMFLLFFLI